MMAMIGMVAMMAMIGVMAMMALMAMMAITLPIAFQGGPQPSLPPRRGGVFHVSLFSFQLFPS